MKRHLFRGEIFSRESCTTSGPRRRVPPKKWVAIDGSPDFFLMSRTNDSECMMVGVAPDRKDLPKSNYPFNGSYPVSFNKNLSCYMQTMLWIFEDLWIIGIVFLNPSRLRLKRGPARKERFW